MQFQYDKWNIKQDAVGMVHESVGRAVGYYDMDLAEVQQRVHQLANIVGLLLKYMPEDVQKSVAEELGYEVKE